MRRFSQRDHTPGRAREGGTIQNTIWLETEPTDTVTVTQTISDTTLISADPAIVTFTPGNWKTRVVITYTAIENDVDEDPDRRKVTVTYALSGGDYDGLGDPAPTTLYVRDDDRRGLDTHHSLALRETASTTIPLTLESEPTDAVTVTLSVADRTAATVSPATVRFTPSNWSDTVDVTVAAVDDAIPNPGGRRTTRVDFAASGGDYEGLTHRVTVYAWDDEPHPRTMAEGSTQTRRLGAPVRPGETRVLLITSSDPDVVSVSPGKLTWTPQNSGQRQPVTLTAVENDKLGDGHAMVTYEWKKPDHRPTWYPDSVTVTDNDAGRVIVSTTALSVGVGLGTFYSVALSREPTGTVTVTATTDAPGVATVHKGQQAGGESVTLTFGPRSWDRQQHIAAYGQSKGSATITHAVSGGGYDGVSADGVAVTVTDPPVPTLSLSASEKAVDEGRSLTLTARLSWGLPDDVKIPLVVSRGTAEEGDYEVPADIVIAAGRIADSVTVVAAHDADEDDETFTVSFGALPGEVSGGSSSSVELTVRDDDGDAPPPSKPAVSLSARPTPHVTEGGAVVVKATLSKALPADVTIPLTVTPGTAEAGDHGTLSGITVPAGRTSGEGTITTAHDADEDDETFTVSLGALPAEVRAGSPSSIELTIRDDDGGTPPPPKSAVSLSASPNPVDEGNSVTVAARLSGTLASGVTIPLTVTAGTAEAGDYGTLASITVGTGETTATGTVVTFEDADEDDETFTVSLGALPASVTAGTPSSVTVTIRDDDDDPPRNRAPSVTASCDPCSVARGGEVRLTAAASDPDGDPLTYAWRAPQGGFSGANRSVARWTAPAQAGRVTISVAVSDGRGGSASASVEIKVVNRAPAFGQPAYGFELPENLDGRESPAVVGAVAGEDPDGDALTYALADGDRERFAVGVLNGVVLYVGAGEDFETEPNRFELTVRVSDRFGEHAEAPVAVMVTDVNEAPEAADDEAVTAEDEAVTVDVLANDTDPEGDRLRVRSVTAAAHGAVRLVSGGRVTYTPEADFHGADSFTYVVSDGGALRDTATVKLTVLPVNDAPTVVGTIPDQALDEGGGPVRMDLSPYFGDVDGDALAYGARSNDTGVVLASVAGAVLTLTPVVYGSATVTVTAGDPAGLDAVQSVRVGVSDRPQRAVLGNVLAATARGHLASARAALGRRVAAPPCEAPRLAVMGRSVPLGQREAAEMLRQIGSGARSAVASPLGLVEGAGERPPALAANTVPEIADGVEAALRSVPVGALGIGGGGSGAGTADFLLGWGGEEEDGEPCPVRGRWSLWGQGDIQRFEGTPSVHGYDSGYDGELSTAYMGLDTRLGARWLAGVALSRSRGTGDWRTGASEGQLTQFMTAVHPYIGWDGGSTSVWASVGAGRGDARNAREAGRTGASPTDLRLGLVELERRVGAPGGLDFAFVGDAAWARLRTGEGEETIDRQDIDVNQVRLGFDLSLPARLGGLELTPSGTVHARRDGGAGQTGDGIEVAGGLRAVLGIVRLDARARMLAHHTAEGYGERGAAVTLALGRQGSDEGFSLSVSPRWGGPARASGALLHGPLEGGFRRGGPEADRWTLDARASYGVNLPGGLRFDLHGSYGAAGDGPRLGLSVARLATAAKKSEG